MILVPGTWGREQAWYRPYSALATYLRDLGIHVYEPGGRPFVWSTDANGWQFWRRWGLGSRDRDHWDWQAGGEALYSLIVPPLAPERRIPPDQTIIISHSHGLQVVLYACAAGLKVDRLVDIAGPVRGDMRGVHGQAAPNIRAHLHLHSDDSDRMQIFGAVGDGVFGVVRKLKRAGVVNRELPKAGHSGVLHDPAWMARFWPEAADWLATA